MNFAADFTAIDFETASRRADSACQLAAVTVRGGRIVAQDCWLIRPEPCYFSEFHIKIHGITPAAVEHAPRFGELWPEISDRLTAGCLVAHNATFDIGVLLACLQSHRLAIPELEFTCTRAVARRTWPHRQRYGLKPLATWLGIRFRHHDALEDSLACAKLLLAAGIDQGADSLEDLERRLRLRRGRAGSWGMRAVTAGRARRGAAAPAALRQVAETSVAAASGSAVESEFDLQRALVRGAILQPLRGKRVLIVGRFRLLSTEQLRALTVSLGGSCCELWDDQVQLVVAEGHAARAVRHEAGRLREQGRPIEILDERGFLELANA